MKLAVKVSPGARRNKIPGWEDNYPGIGRLLKLKIAAPPTEGRANKEITNYLATLLRIPKKSVRIVRGSNAHIKLIELPDDVDLQALSR